MWWLCHPSLPWWLETPKPVLASGSFHLHHISHFPSIFKSLLKCVPPQSCPPILCKSTIPTALVTLYLLSVLCFQSTRYCLKKILVWYLSLLLEYKFHVSWNSHPVLFLLPWTVHSTLSRFSLSVWWRNKRALCITKEFGFCSVGMEKGFYCRGEMWAEVHFRWITPAANWRMEYNHDRESRSREMRLLDQVREREGRAVHLPQRCSFSYTHVCSHMYIHVPIHREVRPWDFWC